MEFDIPKVLRIAGRNHRVKFDVALSSAHSLKGLSELDKGIISIDASLSWEERRRTFIHETLHQIGYMYDLKLTESQVKRLTHGLSEVVQQLRDP